MRTSNAAVRVSKEVHSLDSVRPAMAKAVQHSPTEWTNVVRQGLLRACGSMKAASISMRIDQSQLNRELESGRFNLERVAALSADERAKFFAHMHEECAPLATPLARLREIRRQQTALIDEAIQIAEALAS